jgi:3-hydroxyisobutyrate dehydrogenase
MRVGFIGVGTMGGPMAENLAKAGFLHAVHDRDAAKAQRYAAQGARVANFPKDCAEGCDALITCLPGPAEVQEAASGATGFLAGMKRGSTWIDCTTNDVPVFKALAEKAASQGVEALDCPIAGGLYGARHGKLTIFVGGKAEVAEKHRAVFAAMGEPLHLGPWGSGLAAKVIANMLWYIHLTAMGEAMVMGARAGLKPLVMWDILKRTPATSWAIENDMQSVFAGHYDTSFTLKLGHKDIKMATNLAESLDVPIELGPLVRSIYERTAAQYGGDKAVLYVIKKLEDQAGVNLQLPGEWVAHWQK